MRYFEEKFTLFVMNFLKVIVSIIAITALGQFAYNSVVHFSIINILLLLLYIALGYGMYYALKKDINSKKLFFIILIIGFVLRVLWSFSLDNVPVSDFNQAYQAAIQVVNGDYSSMTGLSYFGRFPHYVIFILYMSKCIALFGDKALLAMKIINILFSTSTIILMHLILKEIFKDYKRVMIGTCISAIMPASILYTPVYCTENLAIPFYLASIYVFLLVMNNKKKYTFLLVSGALLLLGHLFRMTAEVVLIAYVMYIIIYKNEGIKTKVKSIVCVLSAFILPLILIGNLLVYSNVTDRKIWNGSEPKITSVLKGSNIEAYGKWNEEDAKFINDNLNDTKYLEESSRQKIIERYTTAGPLKLIEFCIVKITCQWKDGDCSGAFWAENEMSTNDIKVDMYLKGNGVVQLFYGTLLILMLIGLIKNKECIKNKIINLFYIIFCGYGAMFFIIESQERYAFIINWIFIIFAITSIKSEEIVD